MFTGNVLVRENLDILGLASGKNFSDLVTTYGVDRLHALYIFSGKSQIDENLIVTGPVDGINVSDWATRGLKTRSEIPQIIPNRFEVNGSLAYVEDANGDGLLGGINVRRLADGLEQHQHERLRTEKGLIVKITFAMLCKYIITSLRSRILIRTYAKM